jgi:hypothetical protein
MDPFMNELPSLLGSLGIALCCGLPLLIFAVVTFVSGRKHTQNLEQINRAVSSKISTLKPGNQLVRLEGVIKEVPNAIDGPAESPLAVLRLHIDEYKDDEDGWGGAGDKVRTTHFLLEDDSSSVWVDPQGLNKHSLGASQTPDRERAEAAAILLGLPLAVFQGRTQSQLWELRGGQRVTVIGVVQQRDGRLFVAKPKSQVFIVSSHLGTAIQVQPQQQIKTAWMMTAVLGIPGVLAVCCGLAFLATTLVRMFQ